MPQDGIFRAIQIVLIATVVAGALLTISAEEVFGDPALSYVGTGAAVIAGAIYFFFRYLARREAKKRSVGKNGAKRDESL